MENNGKGINVFYGVIGVATLIITIVGATFAYFSAEAQSDAGAITAAGAEVKLNYTEAAGNETGLKADLIPVDSALTGFKKVVGQGADECQDDNDNNICSVYTFTVSNPATVAQRIYGLIRPSQNKFINLHMAIFKGTAADVGDNFDVTAEANDDEATVFTAAKDGSFGKTADAAAAARKHVIGNVGDLIFADYKLTKDSTTDITVPAFEQVLDPGESATYTIVLWIEETGSAQNDDQKAQFGAGVFFTTEGGSGENKTGVTGVITAS